MLKIIFNQETRQFSVTKLGFDENNWEKSYWSIIRDADKELESIRSLRKSEKVQFRVSDPAEIGYYILDGFSKGLNWTYQYLPKGSDKYDELKNLAQYDIKMIDSILLKLLNKSEDGSHPYVRTKTLNRYFKIDNFNRLVYNANFIYNKVSIKSVLFHHDDKISEIGSFKLWMKKILMDVFNDLYRNDEFQPNLMALRIESLRSKNNL